MAQHTFAPVIATKNTGHFVERRNNKTGKKGKGIYEKNCTQKK
jgi:hypothetical protein